MKNVNDLKYFDDPTLTFEDSIITGCHLDLTFQELLDFCSKDNKFQNLMIFQNLYNLKQIGKYGNSNPHFVDDWIEVEKKLNVNLNSQKDNHGTCQFTNEAKIRIFYQKIGREENPQREIIKADLSWT